VVIDDDTEVLPVADITIMTRHTTAATFRFPPMRDGTPHVPTASDAPSADAATTGTAGAGL
jgi:hypothetical protein